MGATQIHAAALIITKSVKGDVLVGSDDRCLLWTGCVNDTVVKFMRKIDTLNKSVLD